MHRRLQPHAAEADPTCRRCAAMQLACFAVACSQRDVESLLLLSSWSPGQPHGQLTAAVQQLVAGASNSLSPPAWPDGASSEYFWARLVLLVLQCFCQQQQASVGDSSRAVATHGSPGRSPPLWSSADNREAGGAALHQKILRCWLVHHLVGSGLLIAPQLGSPASSDGSAVVLGCSVQLSRARRAQIAMRGCAATGHVQLESRRLAGTLPLHTFPLSCTSTALPTAQQQAIEALWSSLSPAETPVQTRGERLWAAGYGAPAPVGAPQSAVLWPLDGEVCGEDDATAPRPDSTNALLQLSSPVLLLHRRGDFVRSVCVNALNPRQLAVSLGRSVQQVELAAASRDTLMPGSLGSDKVSARPATQWTTWGDGLRNAAALRNPLLPASAAAGDAQLSAQLSSGSDLTARCLCSHPKLPLYLAGPWPAGPLAGAVPTAVRQASPLVEHGGTPQ
eukprot:scaffold82636_cov35-Phaeocystis_antarctica.AAC.1